MRKDSIELGVDEYGIAGLMVGDYWRLQEDGANATSPKEVCELQARAISLSIAICGDNNHNPNPQEVMDSCTLSNS
jgi:hypothetical protein